MERTAMRLRRRANPLFTTLAVLLAYAPLADSQAISPESATPDTPLPASLELPHAPQRELLVYGADVGIGETDNVTLSSNDKVSQTMAIADIDFDIDHASRRLDVEAKGYFTDLDFLQNAYGNDVTGRFDGLARFAIIPDRFTWTLQENWGQAQVDPFAPITPTNQENINYISTGPDFTLRLGSTAFVDVTARYARTDYQVSPFDNQRLMGTVAVGMPLSAQSSVSIDGSSERVLFQDTTLNSDFDNNSVYAHYDLHGARTDVSLNLGATIVEQHGQSQTGPSLRLQIARRVEPTATLTLTAGRDITDGSTAFSTLNSGEVGAIGTVAGIANNAAASASAPTLYTVTYGSAGWAYVRDRTTFIATARWEKDGYEGIPLDDVTRYATQITLQRSLSRAFSAQLLGNFLTAKYSNAGYDEKDTTAGLAVTYRHGHWLEIRLRFDHVLQSVSGVNSQGGYDENRIFLTVGYRPRGDLSEQTGR